ncbi:Uncharacterised protein [Bordetella pertussis]|nr:Uncharacterised protein [Bordetella pertussis]
MEAASGQAGPADQAERIAPDRFAEGQQRGAVVRRAVVVLDDAHRAAPGQVDRARFHLVDRAAGAGGGQPFDFQALAPGVAERLQGVERRIEHGSKVFGQTQFHDVRTQAGCRRAPRRRMAVAVRTDTRASGGFTIFSPA